MTDPVQGSAARRPVLTDDRPLWMKRGRGHTDRGDTMTEPTPENAATITYGSDAVTVHAIIEPPHRFVELHHMGNPDGLHYCPTGFAMCDGAHDPTCTEVRDFDGDCRKWGEA